MLEKALHFLTEHVAPHANELDDNPLALNRAMDQLGKAGLAALKVSEAYNGPNFSEADFRVFQEEAARASGSFAFLQTQHQSAASMIKRSDNEALKTEYLPKMVTGERWLGIGFSQLRRPGPPLLKASATEGGYRLNGHIPWITGYEIFGEVLVGGTLDSGEALFAIIPFASQQGISFSEPMKLAAMESAQTVTADLTNLFVPESQVVFIRPATWISNNDQINITLQGHFALGCARAGLDILKANSEKKPLPFLASSYNLLDSEHEACRAAISAAHATAEEETTHERLQLRAWAIDLAVRSAHAAVTSSAGAANSVHHPAQRVYREALVFTVSAQTSAIMEATLNRLTRP